ncbi:CNNM domain-containing protein [Thalassoglobus sp.]|uniref:CNNM domain-containing protein n=1 Tax=Thalassoglobus sp. TaxID=2795869 RepID=UPI003AA9C5A6
MNELFATVSVWLPGALFMSMLILASAFFSGSETALFYLSREELRRLHSGGASARQAAKLMRQPDQLLTVVLFWNLVINLTYFSISLVTAKRLVEAGAPTMAGAFSILSLLAMILFGEVAPKSLAVLFRRTIAVWASWPLSGAVRVLAPILPVLGATTRGLRRAMWPQLKAEPYLELDDIERAIETSELGTELVQLEQKILGRILHLSEMTAEELMRPRGTYEIYQSPVTVEDIYNHSRMPAYLLIGGEDRDTISSAIPLDEISSLPERDLEAIAEPVTYVPWCATVAESLSQLRSQLISIAVVINEYGESIGVITEDDILDTLLDPESSRAKRLLDREPVRRRKDGKIIAEGVTTLRYLSQWLKIDFEPDEDRLLTIVALMHESLERFPEVGDESIWEGLHFRVIKEGGPGEPILVEVAKYEPATDDESNSS